MLKTLTLGVMLFATPWCFGSDGCQPLPQPLALQDREANPYEHGLLFEIAMQGKAASYIFGTMHVADSEVVKVEDKVLVALRDSGTFVMEALLDQTNLAEFSQRMLASQVGELRRDLTPEIYQRLLALMRDYRVPEAFTDRLKPWAAFMTLAVPPASSDGQPLDLVLLDTAKRNGLKVRALETLAEQADVMEHLSHVDQLALLRDTICHYSKMRDDLQELKASYVNRELGSLYRSAQKYAGPGGIHHRHLIENLLSNRNALMATRLSPLLKEGRVFIAVGALHLPGKQGLLARIANAGYTIKQRY